MKKLLSLLLIVGIVMSMTACGGNATNNEQSEIDGNATNNEQAEKITSLKAAETFEELEAAIEKDIDGKIGELTKEVENFLAGIDTYEKYSTNIDAVKAFYANLIDKTSLLCIGLREYGVAYAEFILESDKSFTDKYDDLDEIYDIIYKDARDEIYDEIYDEIFDEMYDALYDKIMDDAYDKVPYKTWSEIKSAEYDLWSDSKSEVYEIWSDCGSDVYDFWSDMRSAIYQNDTEKANKKIDKYKKDIEELYKDLTEIHVEETFSNAQ